MPIYKGKIIKGNAELTGEIAINVDESSADSVPKWSGKFSLPPGKLLNREQLGIRWSDGRTAEICIYRLDSGPNRSTIAVFHGVGELRRAS